MFRSLEQNGESCARAFGRDRPAAWASGGWLKLSLPKEKLPSFVEAAAILLAELGCGSTLKKWGYAGFSLWFHIPRCHVATSF